MREVQVHTDQKHIWCPLSPPGHLVVHLRGVSICTSRGRRPPLPTPGCRGHLSREASRSEESQHSQPFSVCLLSTGHKEEPLDVGGQPAHRQPAPWPLCPGSGSPSLAHLGHEPFPEQELVQGCSQLSPWGPGGGVEKAWSPCVNSGKPSSLPRAQCPIFRMDWGMLSKAFRQRGLWPHGGGSHQLGFIRAVMRGGRDRGGPGAHHCPLPTVPPKRHKAVGGSGGRFIVRSTEGWMGWMGGCRQQQSRPDPDWSQK